MTDITLPRPIRLPWKLGGFLGGLLGLWLAFSTLTSNSFNVEVTEVNDAEHGPTQISGGLCPGIPTGAADFIVTTEGELTSALSSLNGSGGIIEISDGSYNWSGVIVSASGANANNPIYIRSETLYGATLGAGSWKIQGKYIVISGFTRPMGPGEGFVFELTADNIRLACNDFVGTGITATSMYIRSPSSNTARVDDVEIDNNKFRDWYVAPAPGIAELAIIRVFNCDQRDAACGGVPQRWHVHHNQANDRTNNESKFWYPGLGYIPSDPDDAINDAKQQANFLFENNEVDWESGEDWEDTKWGGGIYRFNCFTGQTRGIHTRAGNHNLIYGNWWEDRSGDSSTSGTLQGWGHYHVYNYVGNGHMLQLRSGIEHISNYPLQWAYMSASLGVFSNNVCDNCSEFIRQASAFGTLLPSQYKPTPEGNLVQNNIIRRATSVPIYSAPSDGHTNQTEFLADNTYTNNTTPGNPKSNSVACFTPGHADGSTATVTGSSRLSTFDGTIDYSVVIPPPSWW